MSTSTSPNRTSTWVGIAVGVVLLGLMVAFAVGLPKALGESSGDSLSLPDTLPGGYTAADLPEAFTGEFADRADVISEQQRQTREHGDEVLSDVLDEEAATRTYASEDLQTAIFVQAFRAAGGAFAPDTLPELGDSPQGGTELVAVGDAACIVTRAPSSTGQPVDASAPPSYAQCQLSEGELTVQVGAQGVQPDELVGIADHVHSELQDQ